MKNNPEKRLICCLAIVLFLSCSFFLQSIAAGQDDAVGFSTFEEFCDYCARGAEGLFLCEEADLVISENLEIHSGMPVTFRRFTVPENITFTMIETADYGKNLTIKTNEPETRPKTESLPQTEPPQTIRSRVLKVFDVLEVYLPRLVFFFILLSLVPVMRAAYSDRKQKRVPGPSSSIPERMHREMSAGGNISGQDSSNMTYDTDGEDYFRRERRNWVSQLDEMLKSGMIDKKEYNELKKQYEQDGL